MLAGDCYSLKKEKLKVAKKLLDKGLSAREIAEITGLDISNIGKA